MNTEQLGRESLNTYGSLEPVMRQLRAGRPLDLNARQWRLAHPDGTFGPWRKLVQQCLREALHYDPGEPDLRPSVLERRETDQFIRERIEFNTAPWFRVPGYFYVPKGVKLPAPALVVMHEWGGPMLFGAERVCGPDTHPVIAEHRNTYTSGRALSDWFASQGFCVITIDAYHFGRRAPRGLFGLPDEIDPWNIPLASLYEFQRYLGEHLYYGVRQLNWAGTTWCGVNFGDDSRCVDYLLSRPEVDGSRIGVTGLSGGGWRTNLMAALDDRIRAAVPVGWMTTGDTQQTYNLAGAIGTFCLLPGVWNRLDIPDLIAMAAPKACMVVSGTQDILFPPAGQRDAARQIADAYAWAGCPNRFQNYAPDKPHCYDAEIQQQALEWFRQHLS
ncbi:MAG: acetylxylan esterase [Phycisphaeraceae bacterium]|nr:acetylxylan esterase [Phycisphaeraceae bacterium]